MCFLVADPASKGSGRVAANSANDTKGEDHPGLVCWQLLAGNGAPGRFYGDFRVVRIRLRVPAKATIQFGDLTQLATNTDNRLPRFRYM